MYNTCSLIRACSLINNVSLILGLIITNNILKKIDDDFNLKTKFFCYNYKELGIKRFFKKL